MPRPLVLLGLLALIAAIGACTSAVPLSPKAIALNREGAAALAAGHLETAEARIALALEYSHRFTEAWVNLGLVELQRGNFDRARRHFLEARRLNPDLPAPHHALALLADREGDGEAAEAGYRAALKVDPGFAPARANLARRLFDRGAFEEAREHFLRLTEVAPDLAGGWTGLCAVMLRLGRVDDAAGVLLRAAEHRAPPATLAVLDARILLERGEFGRAAARLATWTAGGDVADRAAALAWLAVARLAGGDDVGGREAAARAAALAPADGVALYAVAVARGERPPLSTPAR